MDFNKSKLIWDEENIKKYQAAAAKVLLEYQSLFPTPEFIPLKCQLYSDLLVKASELCLDIKPNKPKKNLHPSHELQQAWMHLKKAFNIWKREGK